ncbi:hypothetical protein [Nigerium massiliense]|uniref:hypothetical protein n=1 Tax=Nigerium massiliense TaxID=1522317 RepID=UPI00058AFFB4|nr:hypothetical protein [Nigerium massiliense]
MTDPAGLDAAADELYAIDPAGFVARRTELVKLARAAKDRPLAQAIGSLRRPTLGAWYLNLAVRDRLTSLVALLKLADQLADAQDQRDAARLKQLTAERPSLERRVLRDLTAHLATRGISTTPAALEEVRTTLRAALSDRDAAQQVAAGRLTKPLQYGTFTDDDLSSALAAMLGGAATPGAASGDASGDVEAPVEPEEDRDQDSPGEHVSDEGAETDSATVAEEDDEEERELREARAAFESAQRALAQASAKRDLTTARRDVVRTEAALRSAQTKQKRAEARVRELTAQLEAAQADASAAAADAASAGEVLADAQERVSAAEELLRD